MWSSLAPGTRARRATVVALSVLLGGCGSSATGSDKGPTASTRKTTATTTTTTTTTVATTARTTVVWSFRLHADSTKRSLLDGAAADGRGDVYVVDAAADQVVELDPTGHERLRFGSRGSGPGQFQFVFPFEPGGSESFAGGGVAVGADGAVYVADVGNDRVEKFTGTGKFESQWVKGDDGSSVRPFAVAVDGEGSIYVTDDRSTTAVVRKLDPSGHLLARFGHFGAENITNPNAAAVTDDGSVFVPDDGGTKQRIVHFSPAGRILGSFGEYGTTPGTIGQAIWAAAGPDGVYIADTLNGWIDVFRTNGTFERALTGPGTGHFVDEETVAVDQAGDVYVFDSGVSTLYKLHPIR